jgi:hypothetical protein
MIAPIKTLSKEQPRFLILCSLRNSIKVRRLESSWLAIRLILCICKKSNSLITILLSFSIPNLNSFLIALVLRMEKILNLCLMNWLIKCLILFNPWLNSLAFRNKLKMINLIKIIVQRIINQIINRFNKNHQQLINKTIQIKMKITISITILTTMLIVTVIN